jgi:hypothetical protein
LPGAGRHAGASILLTILIALAIAPVAAEPTAILLDDFESGIGSWLTNDSQVAQPGQRAELCGIYASSMHSPAGGAQAAMLDFLPGRNAWASVSLSIDGSEWRDRQVRELSMWVRGAERNTTVTIALRARMPIAQGGFQDRSYTRQVHLSPTSWQHISLRFFGFHTRDGQTLGEDAIAHLYLLQFVKTGTWERTRFYVDRIEARPLLYNQQAPISSADLPEPIVVDLRQQLGRCLAQVGFNLSPDEAGSPVDQTTLRQLSTHAAALRPCVGRFKLSNYYDKAQGQFDLFRINETVKWLSSIGIRPLVCVDVPDENVTGQEHEILWAQLQLTAAKVAELNRNSTIAPYYELSALPTQADSTQPDDLIAGYRQLATLIHAAAPSAVIGGRGLLKTGSQIIQETIDAAKLGFFSYHLSLPGPTWPDDERLASAAHTGALTAGDWGYEQAARYLATSAPGTELFITEWGVQRSKTADAAVRADQETAEALFLVTSALSAGRFVDKLLWRGLADRTSGLLDERDNPRPAYWAAWLVNTYAPRGSVCRAFIQGPDNLLVTAVSTRTANNIFVINRSPWPTTVQLQVVGMDSPGTVREHRLELSQAQTVQHRNLPLSKRQNLEFEGCAVTVLQFIPAGNT